MWKPDPSSLSDSIKAYSGTIEELDSVLIESINSGRLGLSDIDDEVFRLCFELGLNNVIRKLLKSNHVTKVTSQENIESDSCEHDELIEGLDSIDSVAIGKRIRKSMIGNYGLSGKRKSQDPPYDALQIPVLSLESNVDESIIKDILKIYRKDVTQTLHHVNPETGDNLLHILLRRRFQDSMMILMLDYDIDHLYFNANNAGDMSIMIEIDNSNVFNRGAEDNIHGPYRNITITIWENMIKSGRHSELNSILTCLNSNQKNIFHNCAENQRNDLLLIMCKDVHVKPDVLEMALNQENGDKHTPLDCCSNEDTILCIIDILPKFDTAHKDGKGNNVIHIFGKKNFKLVIQKIFMILSDQQEIIKLLMHKNDNGNNPLMSCTFKNSSDTLNLLLCTLFTFQGSEQNHELVGSILHDQNTIGNTLLSLILHYQQSRALSKTLALQMEKNYHSVYDKKSLTLARLTKCLRDNVEPSVEVLNALKDVEDCYEKSKLGMIMVFITLFITLFLIPFLVMTFDITFDVLLLIEYYKDMDKEINSTEPCVGLNSSKINIIQANTEKLLKIPDELTGRPRFYYSLGFLFFPWIFYSIEFLHSSYYTHLLKKVFILSRLRIISIIPVFHIIYSLAVDM